MIDTLSLGSEGYIYECMYERIIWIISGEDVMEGRY